MRKFLLYLLVALLFAPAAFGATTYRYGDNVQTVRGDAISGATVTVYVANTTTKVDLYSGPSTGFAALTNPIYSDGYGRFSFYAVAGTYDIAISGVGITSYTLEDVRIFGQEVPWYDITDYGAISGDSLSDSTAVALAIAAAGSRYGGQVMIPPGDWDFSGVTASVDSIEIYLSAGAVVSSSDVDGPAITLSGSNYSVIRGPGKIVGPGKGSAVSGSYGIAITNSSYVVVDGVEISGFYHGIRPDDNGGSENNQYRNLYIHDCAFAGIFPKDGDIVFNNRFKDIGTLGTHHGLYINGNTTAGQIARGMSIANNHYEGISGSAVHIYSDTTMIFRNITMSGESVYDCGRGYTLDVLDGRDITIAGAAISGCDSIDANTGQGIHINSAGSIKGLRVDANIVGCDSHGLNVNTNLMENCFFSVTVDSCGYRGVNFAADDCAGDFVVGDNGGAGLYMNGANRNNFVVRSRNNGGLGVVLTGTSMYNFISGYVSNNASHGFSFGASADSNLAVGVSGANGGSEVNDSGAGNITTDVLTW